MAIPRAGPSRWVLEKSAALISCAALRASLKASTALLALAALFSSDTRASQKPRKGSSRRNASRPESSAMQVAGSRKADFICGRHRQTVAANSLYALGAFRRLLRSVARASGKSDNRAAHRQSERRVVFAARARPLTPCVTASSGASAATAPQASNTCQ